MYGGEEDIQEEKSQTELVGVVLGLFGVSEGKRFELRPGKTCIVGKSSESDFQIKSSIISRRHCLIRMLSENVYEITDYSTNGTFYNNVRLEKDKPLNIPKDSIIALGDADNVIQLVVEKREI